MALSAEKIQKAKDEARQYLEYSIYVLAIMLAVDVESLSSDFEIPVEESDSTYGAYSSLLKQVRALEAIS